MRSGRLSTNTSRKHHEIEESIREAYQKIIDDVVRTGHWYILANFKRRFEYVPNRGEIFVSILSINDQKEPMLML